MMRNVFMLLMLFISQVSFGQDTLFLDKKWNQTTRTSAEYFRVTTKTGDKWQRNDYYKNTGLPQMKGSYSSLKPDVEDGIFEWYYASGQLEHRGFFKDGKETGEHIWYFDNGNIDAKETYRNGDLNGPYEEYYRNGKLKSKTIYINDLQSGWTVNYREDGKKESEGNYKADNKNGVWQYFDANENPDTSITYKIDYVIPEAKMYLQLPNDEWFLTDHPTKGSTYTFKRTEVKDNQGRSIVPSIILVVENLKDQKQDIDAYAQKRRTTLGKKDMKFDTKALTPSDKNFPVSYKNATLLTAYYSELGVEHIVYMCYIITKDNKGIQLYMDSAKEVEEIYTEEFLKTLESLKELTTG